jgi:hypothetical protein
MVHRDLIDLAGLQALRAVSDRSGPINNVHMEEDEEDEEVHDDGYDREVDEESDEDDRYVQENYGEDEEIANAIENPGVLDNVELVEDHNEA